MRSLTAPVPIAETVKVIAAIIIKGLRPYLSDKLPAIVTLAVEAGECYPGIAICGSGEGISMTLNKHQGIRAALCWTAEIAHLARQHNDANVLVMPGRFISTEEADMIMREFFSTQFEGGRHQKRIEKIPVR